MDPLNQQPQSTVPPMSTPPVVTITSEHKKVGPIVAILVAILILIIGALYLFASRVTVEPMEMNTAQESVQPVTNTSDDVTSIESDLDASTDGLDGQNF